MTIIEHNVFTRTDDKNTFSLTYHYNRREEENRILRGLSNRGIEEFDLLELDRFTECLVLHQGKALMIKKLTTGYHGTLRKYSFYLSTGTDGRTNVRHEFYFKI